MEACQQTQTLVAREDAQRFVEDGDGPGIAGRGVELRQLLVGQDAPGGFASAAGDGSSNRRASSHS